MLILRFSLLLLCLSLCLSLLVALCEFIESISSLPMGTDSARGAVVFAQASPFVSSREALGDDISSGSAGLYGFHSSSNAQILVAQSVLIKHGDQISRVSCCCC